MKKSKALIINGSDPWMQQSGYFLYSTRLIDLLCENFDVAAVSFYGNQKDLLPAPVVLRRESFSRIRLNPQLQRWLSLFGRKSFCEREFDYPGLMEWLRDVIHRERPDVVLVNHIRAGWMLPILGQLRIPVVYVAHNAEGDAYFSIAQFERNPFGKLFAWIEGMKLRRLERKILQSVSCVISLTEEDRQRLLKIQPDVSVYVVPPCLNIPDFKSVLNPGFDRILIVGSFQWRPKRSNALWFVRNVLVPLKKIRPAFKCVIVGANARALRCKLTENLGVEIHSDVAEVSPFLMRPSIFLVPERQVGGIKLKTCEAASFGLPIVSTASGIEGTGLQDKVSCLVEDSADGMLNAILRIADHPDFGAGLGEAAHKNAEKMFSVLAVRANLEHAMVGALGQDARQ